MKLSLRSLAVIPCLTAFLTIAGNAQITGTEWSGWSSPVPLIGGLPSAGSANTTFSATAIDFCVLDSHCVPPGSGTYTLNGFLTSQGNASGVSGVSFHNGAAGSNTLDNTLWEFSGTAFFTNGEVFNVGHDDGAIMYVNGSIVLNQPGPTAFVLTPFTYTGPTGMESFQFLYGETNGAPAVFETNLQSGGNTPEPSTFALLGTGLLAAAGAIRRRITA